LESGLVAQRGEKRNDYSTGVVIAVDDLQRKSLNS